MPLCDPAYPVFPWRLDFAGVLSNSKWCDETEFSLSKQTAERANSTISGYFQLANESDKKLFESIFSSDIDFNWFEFNRRDNPDLACGIRILGNRNIVFVNNPETFQALDKGERKVQVQVKSLFGGRK